MSNLSEIVDSLENRVGKLLQEHENLKKKKTKLEEEITVLMTQQDQYNKEIENWREEC
ncbi:MAG: putative nucleic acid-binding Zn-ribbon protein, partial [bacterium]